MGFSNSAQSDQAKSRGYVSLRFTDRKAAHWSNQDFLTEKKTGKP